MPPLRLQRRGGGGGPCARLGELRAGGGELCAGGGELCAGGGELCAGVFGRPACLASRSRRAPVVEVDERGGRDPPKVQCDRPPHESVGERAAGLRGTDSCNVLRIDQVI